MKNIAFSKMSGAANDFVLIDNRSGAIKGNLKKFAQKVTDRRIAVGADGLILLEKSKKADLRMRIFNPDGSEAEMCGNGVRCFAKFAVDKKIAKSPISIETLAGIIHTDVKGNIVKARMVDPSGLKLNFSVEVDGKKNQLNFVNTGVPHAVQVVNRLASVEVDKMGKKIRFHHDFSPRGTNANFVSLEGKDRIAVRTYERGVEAETLACGTGSTASALVVSALYGMKSPIKVFTKSKEILKIYFKKDADRFFDVYMEGPVLNCFEGRMDV